MPLQLFGPKIKEKLLIYNLVDPFFPKYGICIQQTWRINCLNKNNFAILQINLFFPNFISEIFNIYCDTDFGHDFLYFF